MRYKGRIDASDNIPINTIEEVMSLNLLDIQTSVLRSDESVIYVLVRLKAIYGW
jgi:hypothetical protein